MPKEDLIDFVTLGKLIAAQQQRLYLDLTKLQAQGVAEQEHNNSKLEEQ